MTPQGLAARAATELGAVEVPSGRVVLSTSDWTFEGIELPPVRPGTWTVQGLDGGPEGFAAVVLGDPTTVVRWDEAPADVTKRLQSGGGAVHVLYDAARLDDVLGLRGAQPWDFGPMQARLQRAVQEGAFVVETAAGPVGVVVDLTRARSAPYVWLGVDPGGAVVSVLLDRQVRASSPTPVTGPAREVALGVLGVAGSSGVLVVDPAGSLSAGVEIELDLPAPVSAWLTSGDVARGCAVVVGDRARASRWEPTGSVATDAGTILVLDARERALVEECLQSDVDAVIDTVIQEGWTPVQSAGRVLAYGVDCGKGDGDYAVWRGLDESGNTVAVLVDLELDGVAAGLMNPER